MAVCAYDYGGNVEPSLELPVQQDDFYVEGNRVVLTEVFLRRRGFCCGFDCRHCPWKKPRYSCCTINR